MARGVCEATEYSFISYQTTELQQYRAIQLQKYRTTEVPNTDLLWYQTTFRRPKGDLKESRIEKGHCDNEKVNGEESGAVSWAINGECST